MCMLYMYVMMSTPTSTPTISLTEEQLQKAKVAIELLSSLPKTEGNIFYINFARIINPSDNDAYDRPSSSSRAAASASGLANG